MADGFPLPGRTALVTGGAKRVGRAICLALAREGVNVVVHYNSSDAEAEQTCRELTAFGVQAWPLRGDLSDPDACERLVAACRATAGAVDIVVNSASEFVASCLAALDLEELARAMQVHALAPLQLIRGLLGLPPTMPGRVVNMLDAHLQPPQRMHVAYNLSKRALQALTEMLAIEMAPLVTVNAVAPGIILQAPGQSQATFERMARANPLGRPGEVHEVVEAVMYLLQADFVTGQVLYVDGGARL